MSEKKVAKIKFEYREINGDSSAKAEIIVPLFVASQSLSQILDWKENTEIGSMKCAEEYLEAIREYEAEPKPKQDNQ